MLALVIIPYDVSALHNGRNLGLWAYGSGGGQNYEPVELNRKQKTGKFHNIIQIQDIK